jgi:hypothetical protein
MVQSLSFPLSNVQLELLKIYSTNISDNELGDLKKVLSNFFAKKSIALANQVWDEKGYTDEDMERLLNSENQ